MLAIQLNKTNSFPISDAQNVVCVMIADFLGDFFLLTRKKQTELNCHEGNLTSQIHSYFGHMVCIFY